MANSEKWYVFLIIGLIIGAVLGYYFAGGFEKEVVGRTAKQQQCWYNCYSTARHITCASETTYEGWKSCEDTWLDRCASACGINR